MKKILSLFLCLAVLLTAFTVVVSAEENYCEIFEKQWHSLTVIEEFGNENTPWSANTIAYVTAWNFDRDEYQSQEDEYLYNLPADKFEALAKKLFNVKVDLKTAAIGEEPQLPASVKYNSDKNTYDMYLPPVGGPSQYAVYGYSKLGDTYTVYLEAEADGEALGIYAKATATCDGTYAKLIAFEKVTRVPAKNTLITPAPKQDSPLENTSSDTVSSVESAPASSNEATTDTSSETDITNRPTVSLANKYDVSLSATEGVFPEGTKVIIQKKTDSASLDTIKAAIGDSYEKFVAFDFSATVNGTTVQPEGTVTVTFKLPSDYDIDKVSVLYLSEDGKVENINSTPEKATRTISAELSHLSTYVFALTASDEVVAEKDSSPVLVIILVVIAVLLLGGAAAWYFLLYKKGIDIFKKK